MKRSEMRESLPGFRFAHPGYKPYPTPPLLSTITLAPAGTRS